MNNTFELIYHIVRQIPYGRVTTYGQIARMLNTHINARIVGFAMSGCTDDSVPCHRVVNRYGGLADAFTPLGKETHRLLLEMEGVAFMPEGNVDLEGFMWYGSDE